MEYAGTREEEFLFLPKQMPAYPKLDRTHMDSSRRWHHRKAICGGYLKGSMKAVNLRPSLARLPNHFQEVLPYPRGRHGR